jgi:acetyl/propionyl-CoA carboxylase alpha subunit
MPGLILEISVVVGQEVKETTIYYSGSDEMENSFSPRWRYQIISLLMGDAVDKGQLLIEFE